MSLKKIDGNLESVADQLEKIVAQAQEDLIPVLIKALEKLDYSGGSVVLNDKNLLMTSEIVETIRDALESGVYIEGIRDYSKSFPNQAELINGYFAKSFSERFAEKQIFNTIVRDAQIQALESLTGSAIDQVFEKPMKSLIQKSITTGASFQEMVEDLNTFIIGNDNIEGGLLRYTKQIARDTFSNYTRSYTDVLSKDLDVQWFSYDGGTVRDSRAFCLERAGKIFHRKEIEAWGNGQSTGSLDYPEGGEWQGKARGTNGSTIFSFLGGYNCIHYLAAMPDSLVPNHVKDRARAEGYIE